MFDVAEMDRLKTAIGAVSEEAESGQVLDALSLEALRDKHERATNLFNVLTEHVLEARCKLEAAAYNMQLLQRFIGDKTGFGP